MKDPGCKGLGELKSAYLDGALADEDRERVLAHLVGCGSCRAEVEELRTVRRLLQRLAQSTGGHPTSQELSSRLVSIAGRDAYLPVWSRPFRRTRAGTLPSGRHAVRMRTTAAALAFGGLVSALGVVGYVAAPTLDAAVIADPTARVKSDFAASLSDFPLTSQSINALLVAPRSDLGGASNQPRTEADTATDDQPIPRASAVAYLRWAANEADDNSYTGHQLVVASDGSETVSATVRIVSVAGQGSDVTVLDASGQSVIDGFVRASSSRIADQELLTLLFDNYSISGWSGERVAGRPVTVVEASADSAGGDGPAVARWWIDNETGLLLWQETYDASGNIALAAGFTSIQFKTTPFMTHLAPRLATSTTTASLTLSNVTNLVSRGWYCEDELAGLSLVRLRSDEASEPGALHMIYSDGVSTLSVFEQHGKLSGPPAGYRLDASLRAYRRAGPPAMATWQSGDTVFTVVTDGSRDLLEDAVAALPHQKLKSATTMGRVRAGWVRVIKRVVG